MEYVDAPARRPAPSVATPPPERSIARRATNRTSEWLKEQWEILNGRDLSEEERTYNKNWYLSRHANKDCVPVHKANPTYEAPRERRVEGDNGPAVVLEEQAEDPVPQGIVRPASSPG